ncbi:hypothetical protein INT48_008624 [Thamnidium elegans]|uniref:Uncharacterized protein n=1 Tax=Thamnidium elegans TaxID=101142 RepID=A0A8H7SSS8_9FUNG|nr:hypothetical protein INT48_008624 [Thamnidium elegans]
MIGGSKVTLIQPQQYTTNQQTIQHRSTSTQQQSTYIQPHPTSSQQTSYSIPQDGILPGGRLQHFLSNWEKMTSQPWPISNPYPWRTKPLKMTSDDQLAADQAVENFLNAGIIKRSPTQNRDFLSTFFTIQEAKRRPILNCTKLNQFFQVQYFNMEGVPALRDTIEKDDYICKVDLKDAYVVVPIHKESQVSNVREQRYRIPVYLSSLWLKHSSESFLKANALCNRTFKNKRDESNLLSRRYLHSGKIEESNGEICSLTYLPLEQLGFLINKAKSVFEPKTSQEFLGFLFNTRTMKISLPIAKINKLLQRLRQVESPTIRSCRWIASLLEKMTAVIPAIGEALLYVRHMQRDLAKALHNNHQQWDKACHLSQEGKNEIQWWEKFLIQKNGLPIHKIIVSDPALKVYVDASDIGWGITSSLVQTAGFWTNEEKNDSINVRELKTIYYAILIHAKKVNNVDMKIYSDNMTALKYVTKAGGTASFALQDLAVKIQDICNLHHLTVQYQHIPGVQNVKADQLSRSKKPTTSLLELPGRPIHCKDRCIQSELEEERSVPIPTVKIDSEGAQEVETRPNQGGDIGDAIMEEPVLVSSVAPNEPIITTDNLEIKPEMGFDRLEIISNYRKANGMNEELIEHLNSFTRLKTTKMYDTA